MDKNRAMDELLELEIQILHCCYRNLQHVLLGTHLFTSCAIMLCCEYTM
jgi:heme A synthase